MDIFENRLKHVWFAVLLSVLSICSALILKRVNLRIWRIRSWIYGKNWPRWLLGPQLEPLAFATTIICVVIVVSPALLPPAWGCEIGDQIKHHKLVEYALILCGPAVVFATYALLLWRSTKWQSSRAVMALLCLSVLLLFAYEGFAVQYVTKRIQGSHSALFFGASAIALAINMLPICCMVFNGDGGLDLDEYVKRAYVYARATSIQVQQTAIDPQPPDLTDPSLYLNRSNCRQNSAVSYYLMSVVVLLIYSILFWHISAKQFKFLGIVTSAAVLVTDWIIGSCVFTLKLVQNRIHALALAFVVRCLLISCKAETWYLGHCLAYAAVASVLLAASVAKWYPIVSAAEGRVKELASTVDALRSQFWQKVQGQTMTKSMFSGSLTNRGMTHSYCMGSEVGRQLRAELDERVGYGQRAEAEDGPGELSFSGLQGVMNREGGYVFDKGKARGQAGAAGRSGSYRHQSGEGQEGGGGRASGRQASTVENPAAARFRRMVAGGGCLRGKAAVDESLGGPSWCDAHWSIRLVFGTPQGVWAIFSLLFVVETVVVETVLVTRQDTKDQDAIVMKYGVAALLLAPIVASIVAYLRSLRACRWKLTKKPLIIGTIAAALTLAEGLFIAIVFRSSIVLAFGITLPFLGISLSIAAPMWIQNGCKFLRSDKPEPLADKDESTRQLRPSPDGLNRAQGGDSGEFHARSRRQLPFSFRQNLMMCVCVVTCILSVVAVAVIIWREPLGNHDVNGFYLRPAYLGSAIASAMAMLLLIWLPCVAWFSTYRASPSMIICLVGSMGVLVGFCGGSYAIIRTERGKYDMDDVLAAFLPLLCIPSVTAILVGIYKWKDDGWKVSKAAFRLVAGGWLLLALVTILIGVKCWQVAGLFMFVLLLVFLGMAAAYRWVAHNFYLTRWEMVFVALMSLLLALGAFLFGILTGERGHHSRQATVCITFSIDNIMCWHQLLACAQHVHIKFFLFRQIPSDG